MKKTFLFSLVAFLFMLLPGSVCAGIPETSEPIKIILNNWTSQRLLAKITGTIFEDLGYTIEYHDYSTTDQWGAMYRGVYHVQVEVWEGTMATMFERGIETGVILDGGVHEGVSTREEWWYPAYVEKMCPGLPDWRALRDCASIFSRPETMPRGLYLSGPWEKPDLARIRALELPFEVEQVVEGDDLKTALEEAIGQRKPIVLFNWTPNWVEAKYEGRFVEFPKYTPECERDPAWGVNPKYVQDCGNPESGWLKKAAWAGMPKTWPCAFATLKNISFSTSMISGLVLKADVDGVEHDELVKQWLDENEALWRSWIPAECVESGEP